MIQPQLREHFQRQGYAFPNLPNIESSVPALRGAIDQMLAEESAQVIYERDGETPRSLVDPQRHNSVFAALARSPELAQAALQVLGSDTYVFQLGVNLKQAFSGDIWYWHRDFPTYQHQDHIPANRMINVLIYLDDFNRDNGSFMVVPETHAGDSYHGQMSDMGTSHSLHYASRQELSEAIEDQGITFLDGEAGTVIFMNTNLLHASGANLSNAPRRLITLTLNAIDNKALKRSDRPELVMDDRDVRGTLQFHDEQCQDA